MRARRLVWAMLVCGVLMGAPAGSKPARPVRNRAARPPISNTRHRSPNPAAVDGRQMRRRP